VRTLQGLKLQAPALFGKEGAAAAAGWSVGAAICRPWLLRRVGL